MAVDAVTRDRFVLWQTIPVRAADMDARRHVNNATYLIYFEVARRAFFESHGVFAAFEAQRQHPVLVTQTCNYRKPLRYPATIDIGLALHEIKTRSFTFSYGIFLHGSNDLIANGDTTHAWYDEAADKAIGIPIEVLSCLASLKNRVDA